MGIRTTRSRAHLEVPRDETPPEPLRIAITALQLDSEAVQELLELLADADGAGQRFMIDPMIPAPLLVVPAISHKGVVRVQQREVVLVVSFRPAPDR